MSRKPLFEQLIDHYSEKEQLPMSEELETYEQQLDYCYDLLKRHDGPLIWRKLARKFDVSRSTAYSIIRDCREFFSLQMEDFNMDFERLLAIDRLTKLRNRVTLTADDCTGAKAANCYKIAAGIEKQINELKGLYEKGQDIDPATLIPGIIQIVIPTGGRPKMISPDTDKVDQQTIDYVEGINFSVESMRDQIKLLDYDEE